ncbi:eukaryotic translation initiation factor 2A-like [Magnolia sinica]|uniref:eukaryotic translation initiation factor 2A-like n=1 Tax=Magnolia sinica TaxID=86752 RepID=UPI00265AEAAE|nr:eukaryotic translation initiation factor 2A-like [Magnolia sinica]
MRIREPKTTALILASSKMGIPASVQIFSCDKDAQAQPVAWRSFFRCSTMQLHWNYGATGLLTVAQSDVDKTNQSYYGESKLNYLTIDGSHEGLVPLRMIFKMAI